MTDQLPPYTPSREMPSYNPATAPPLPSFPSSTYRSGPAGYYGGPPSTTMATWALVLGIIPIPLGNVVAIVLGIRVLLRGKDGRNHGKGRAITALVIAPLWLLANIAVLTLALSEADRNPNGVVTARGDVLVDSLVVGDCLPAMPSAKRVQRTVEVAPCSEPHWGEVYANFDLADGPFPGDKQVQRLADGGCSKRLEHIAAEAQDPSKLNGFVLYPVHLTWSQDRGVSCIVTTGSPSTGSLRGTES